MVAVHIEGDGYAILEVLDAVHVSVGDVMTWDDTESRFMNVSTGDTFDAIVQNQGVPMNGLSSQLHLP